MPDGKGTITAESIKRHTEALGLRDGAITEALVAVGAGDLLPDVTEPTTAPDAIVAAFSLACLAKKTRRHFPNMEVSQVQNLAETMLLFGVGFKQSEEGR